MATQGAQIGIFQLQEQDKHNKKDVTREQTTDRMQSKNRDKLVQRYDTCACKLGDVLK